MPPSPPILSSIEPPSHQHPQDRHNGTPSHQGSQPASDFDLDTDEIASISSAELRSRRPNRWRGATHEDWLRYTLPERKLADALDALEARDLATHLYDAFLLKRDAGATAAHENSTNSRGDKKDDANDGQNPPAPPTWWTAWPLKPHEIPDMDLMNEQDMAVLADGWDALTLRNPGAGTAGKARPGELLEQEIVACMAGAARRQFAQHQSEWEHADGHASSDADSLDGSQALSSDDETGENGRDTGLEQNGHDRRPRPREEEEHSTTYAPVFSADDDLSRELLLPEARRTISLLNKLLMILHQSRADAIFNATDDDSSSAEDSTYTYDATELHADATDTDADDDTDAPNNKHARTFSGKRKREAGANADTTPGGDGTEPPSKRSKDVEYILRLGRGGRSAKTHRDVKPVPQIAGETERDYVLRICRIKRLKIPRFDDVVNIDDSSYKPTVTADESESLIKSARDRHRRRPQFAIQSQDTARPGDPRKPWRPHDARFLSNTTTATDDKTHRKVNVKMEAEARDDEMQNAHTQSQPQFPPSARARKPETPTVWHSDKALQSAMAAAEAMIKEYRAPNAPDASSPPPEHTVPSPPSPSSPSPSSPSPSPSEQSTPGARKTSHPDRPRASSMASERDGPSEWEDLSGPSDAGRFGDGIFSMRLRDWSDIVNAAALAGFPASVVTRTAQRCADLFGQGMNLITLQKQQASNAPHPHKQPPRNPIIPGGNAGADWSSEDEEQRRQRFRLLARRQDVLKTLKQRRRAASKPGSESDDQAGSESAVEKSPMPTDQESGIAMPATNAAIYCPFPDCPRHTRSFNRKRHVMSHLQWVHRLSVAEARVRSGVAAALNPHKANKHGMPPGWCPAQGADTEPADQAEQMKRESSPEPAPKSDGKKKRDNRPVLQRLNVNPGSSGGHDEMEMLGGIHRDGFLLPIKLDKGLSRIDDRTDPWTRLVETMQGTAEARRKFLESTRSSSDDSDTGDDCTQDDSSDQDGMDDGITDNGMEGETEEDGTQASTDGDGDEVNNGRRKDLDRHKASTASTASTARTIINV